MRRRANRDGRRRDRRARLRRARRAARTLLDWHHRCAALLGGALVALADLLGRTIIARDQLPAGLLTAIIATPCFLWLLHPPVRSVEGMPLRAGRTDSPLVAVLVTFTSVQHRPRATCSPASPRVRTFLVVSEPQDEHLESVVGSHPHEFENLVSSTQISPDPPRSTGCGRGPAHGPVPRRGVRGS
ncbi:iron chelate uptake ABC transporter family permease subunit [Streptomyces sp. 4N509B]|uniref:iron chelate uptake ABC transporter family permease subunit n=1 Tax=Streptomyces sp. 4N509B TaxID=3457413 RepID=UPI003FD53271